MNTIYSVSDVSEPPLIMLFLAAFSLVFNLCFPQYTAVAHAESQKFAHNETSKESVTAINEARVALQDKKEAEKAIQKETPNSIVSASVAVAQAPAVTHAVKTAAAKPKKSLAVKTDSAQAAAGTTSKWVTVTAYSSTVDQCDASPFITASGTHVRDGIIATNMLAFGTKVKFPSMYGDKIFIVEDRMNQRFSNRADIWFETREQAKAFGVRKLEMVIVS